jgi:hypothetical protein
MRDTDCVACRLCRDEVQARDLSDSGLCIECRYELERQMPDPQDVEE